MVLQKKSIREENASYAIEIQEDDVELLDIRKYIEMCGMVFFPFYLYPQ